MGEGVKRKHEESKLFEEQDRWRKSKVPKGMEMMMQNADMRMPQVNIMTNSIIDYPAK